MFRVGITLLTIALAWGAPIPTVAAPLFRFTELLFQPVAINNVGQIAGNASGQAVLWSDGITQQLGSGNAVDINDHGEVLGQNWIWKPGIGRILPGFTNADLLPDLVRLRLRVRG